jgi:hypothetical protein
MNLMTSMPTAPTFRTMLGLTILALMAAGGCRDKGTSASAGDAYAGGSATGPISHQEVERAVQPNGGNRMSQLAVEVGAEVRDGQLLIRYTVRNKDERDAYLLNRLPRGSPPKLSPDFAYVELDAKSRILVVSKRMASVPSTGTSGPTVPVAPYVTPVRAGGAFTETIRLAIPVRIYREYGRSPAPDPHGDRAVEYQGLRLVLGYYWRDPGVTETPGEAAGGEPVILPGSFPRFPEMLEFASELVPVRVTVFEPRS